MGAKSITLRSIGVAATQRGRCHSKVTSPTDFTHRNTGLQTGTAILYTVVYYCHLVVKCRKFDHRIFHFAPRKEIARKLFNPMELSEGPFRRIGNLILADFFFFSSLVSSKVYVSLYLEEGTWLLQKREKGWERRSSSSLFVSMFYLGEKNKFCFGVKSGCFPSDVCFVGCVKSASLFHLIDRWDFAAPVKRGSRI